MRAQVGPYRIRDVLGQGAMGVVYAADDDRLGRTIAIKTLSRGGDRLSRERLLREARAAARLNHPGICQVFDVVEEKGELWVAMELLEGESLFDRLKRERLGVEKAVEITQGILGPLGFLHARGLVHRDLKPSNIFVTPHGVKLLDFSLTVQPIGETQDPRVTQEGSIVGTPHYMAPEQWRAQEIGSFTDLFACGAILYEMLARRYAFSGEDPIDVFHACAFEDPPPLGGVAGIEALDEVVRRALEKKPEDRFETAAEMGAALSVALDRYRAVQTGTRAPGPGPTVEQIQRFIALPFRMLRPDPETEFLATSLPEAISASLAGLEHLVVRSTALAEVGNGRDIDLKRLAAEVEVDYALRGSLMSAGSRLRLTAQLVEVPEGTVVWTLKEEVPLGDLFELQDDLVRRVVDGLAVPLSPTEEERLHHDVPASARAYELYLRALHAGERAFTRSQTVAVRDLLRSCLDEDPSFAPAWARYARVCRIISKYGLGDTVRHLELARQGFERALALNPDSPLVHNYYTYYELEERGDPVSALRRLLGRVRERAATADLYAGLVAACRFAGLYQASLAAHERASRLDPNVETSVHHTYFQLGQTDRVEGHDLLQALITDDARAIELLHEPKAQETEGVVRDYVDCVLAALEDRREDCEDAYHRALATGLRDPEHWFYFARALSRAGAGNTALEAMEQVVKRGFFCPLPLQQDAWLEPMRAEGGFTRVLERAEKARAKAVAAYVEEEGETLLGVAET